MKVIVIALILSISAVALSDESWTVGGKTFDSKPLAIRYAMSSGKITDITHTECVFLTQKLSFKKCPKNKAGNFENQPFTNVSKTPDRE
jgi:hypothetical protein